MSRGNLRRSRPEERKAKRARVRNRFARVMLVSGVIVASAAGSWWLNQSMSIDTWKIEATPALKRAISEELQAMPSLSFLATRPALLRRQWMANIPDIAELRISRILPDKLLIRADARQPVALWQDENNTIHLLDDSGLAYRTLHQGESPDLPILRIEAERMPFAHDLLMVIREQRLTDMKSLSEIRATSGSWQVYLLNGEKWLLPFGREAKVVRQLASILKQPRWQKQKWRIDARAQSRWFIRPVRRGGVI